MEIETKTQMVILGKYYVVETGRVLQRGFIWFSSKDFNSS